MFVLCMLEGSEKWSISCHIGVDIKSSHNINVESYVVHGGNFYDFMLRRQHLK